MLLAGDGPAAVPSSARPIIADPDGNAVAVGWTEEDDHWLHVPGAGTFRLRPNADHVLSYAEPGAAYDELVDAYRTMALPLALQISGYEALHASAVETARGVAAFCAQSGTGKTTTALGLSRRGYALWADDAVALATAAGGAVLAHRLPFRANVRPRTAEHLGDLPAGPEDDEREPSPLAAVFVLSRAAEAPAATATRLPPVDAMTTLLPHAIRFDLSDPSRRQGTVRNYLEIVATVPVYEVRFAPSLPDLDSLLDEIERALGGLP